MKRLLAIVLSFAVVVMTSAGAWARPDEAACAKPADACCHHSAEHTPAAPVTPPSCAQCCLLGCVMLVPPVVEVSAPAGHLVKWRVADVGAVSRSDQPPVPPPRSR